MLKNIVVICFWSKNIIFWQKLLFFCSSKASMTSQNTAWLRAEDFFCVYFHWRPQTFLNSKQQQNFFVAKKCFPPIPDGCAHAWQGYGFLLVFDHKVLGVFSPWIKNVSLLLLFILQREDATQCQVESGSVSFARLSIQRYNKYARYKCNDVTNWHL